MNGRSGKKHPNNFALRHWPKLTIATLLAFLLGFASASPPANDAVAAVETEIVVYKTPYCGCCRLWVEQLEATGLPVRTIDLDSTAAIQSEVGVPLGLRSCHTAKIGKYWVEGHVPPDLVADLVENEPTGIAGLTVPGMPIGSPGMEGPNARTYEVLRVTTEGKVEVHAVREGRTTPP